MAFQPLIDGSNMSTCDLRSSADQFHTCWLYAPEVTWAGEMVFAECVPARQLHEFTPREACQKCRVEAYKKRQRRQARELRWQARWDNLKSYLGDGENSAFAIKHHHEKAVCDNQDPADIETPSTLTRTDSWDTAGTDSTRSRNDSTLSSTKGSIRWRWRSDGSRKANTIPVTDESREAGTDGREQSGALRRSYTDVFQPNQAGLLDWRIVLAACAIV